MTDKKSNPSPNLKSPQPWWKPWARLGLHLTPTAAIALICFDIGLDIGSESAERVRFQCRVEGEEVICQLPTTDRRHELVFDRIPLKTIGGSSDE